MRKKLKIFTVALCSAAVSLNMAAPYLHAEISQDEIDYKGLPIVKTDPNGPDYFPDAKFQDYLKSSAVDKDGDGYLNDDEIAAVTEIKLDATYAGIEKVDGIEIFTNLERFICEDLASDGSAAASLNLVFNDPDYVSEKYGHINEKLKYVSCNHSNVTGLDLKGCTELEYLNCSDNNTLSALDLSENPELEYLYCSNTALTAPDLTKNTELKVLDCSFKKDDSRAGETGVFNGTSPALATLDLTKNAKLEYLDCSGNTTLTSMTLPSDFSDTVYLKGNSLKYIDCHECGFTSLDLTYGTSLQYLNCSGNNISSGLDVSKNTKLEYLDCSGLVDEGVANTVNTALTLGNDSSLRTLNCSNNSGITDANLEPIEYSKSLETLNCTGTELTSLDLSKNTALETLICEEQYEKTDGSIVPSASSKITDLKLNRLLYKKAGLSFNDIFGNIVKRNDIEIDYGTGEDKSTNVDIYYTGNLLDKMNVVAKDVTEAATFKEGTTATERKVTYTNLDGEAADLTVPDKEGDYTLARCPHLFKDVERISVINGEPVIVYANGAGKNITTTAADGTSTTVRKNSGALKVYTDIAASYKTNENGKALTGKVIVGITDTPDIPTVTNNKIDGASALATAKIKNGEVTVKSKKNTTSGIGNICYLWIVDTGSNGTYECCPVNLLVAPRKLEVRNEKDNDPRLKDATRMIGEELEVCVAGYVDEGKTIRTKDSTYSYSVPDSVKDCVEIEQTDADRFIIKAKAVHNNKDTKVKITFRCDQNNQKINFTLKVSAAPLVSPAPSATPSA